MAGRARHDNKNLAAVPLARAQAAGARFGLLDGLPALPLPFAALREPPVVRAVAESAATETDVYRRLGNEGNDERIRFC